jgi:hypothetical protein
VVTPVVAPNVPTYASYTPYITPQDFLNEPTGVDTSQLIPAGSTLTEEAALARLVANASSEADRICQKTLAATLDVESGLYRIQRDGTIHVPLPFGPVISVNAVSTGFSASSMTPMASLSGIRIIRNVAYIPVPSALPLSYSFSPNPAAYAPHGWIYADVIYVNGWAHSTLAAATLVGASQVAPGNVLGFVPGLPFTVYDGQDTEGAQVASGYVLGATPMPLAAALTYAHSQGVTVSALPPFARLAVVTLAKWLAKTKGTKAIVMPSINGRTVSSAPKTQTTEPGGDADYKQAARDLRTLKRAR